MPSPHTVDALSQVMIDCFMDWNIDNKLSTLTLDNCSTNDAMVDRLLGTLSPSSLILKGRFFHMRCCAHIINLIVQDGFSKIESSIKKVRDSVSFWSLTPKRAQDFRLVARQLSVDCEKELVLDCKTRWNSVYIMLSVALEYKDVFTRLSKKERHYVSAPSEDEWRMALLVCEKLKLFYRVTGQFSGTKYPTSNLFFPLMCDMKVSIMRWLDDPDVVIRNMASCMLTKLDKYWAIIHDVMSVAIVLDPRHKLKLIHYFFPKIYGANAKDEIMRVRSLCSDLFEEYRRKYDQIKGKGQSCTTQSDLGSSLDADEAWVMEYATIRTEDDVLEATELDQYLTEKLLPFDQKNFDILVWWGSNGSKFPVLQRIARDILAIPISTVASESAFSMSGNKITKQRSRLKAQTVTALMCTQSWLKKELEGNNYINCYIIHAYINLLTCMFFFNFR